MDHALEKYPAEGEGDDDVIVIIIFAKGYTRRQDDITNCWERRTRS